MNFRQPCLCILLFLQSLPVLLPAQSPSYPSTKISGLILTDAAGNSAASLGDGLGHATPTADSQSVFIGSGSPGPDTAQASGSASANFGTLRTSLSATAQYATGTNNYQAEGNATVQFYDRIQFNNPDLAPFAWIDVKVSLGLSESNSLAAVASSNGANASILVTQTLKLGAFGDTQLANPYITLTNSDAATFDSLHGLAAGDPPVFHDSVTYHFQNGVTYSFTAYLETDIVANARVIAGGSTASAILDASHTGLVGFEILTSGSTYTTGSNTVYTVDATLGAIPEPSTYTMIAGAGVLGVALWRRRFSR